VQALVWDGSVAALRQQEEPRAEDGMAVVRVLCAGICNTDLEILRGYLGFRGILGHEFVGRVEEGPDEWKGVRVVGEINFACGSCPLCSAGLRRHCPSRRVLGIQEADGVFAERVALPVVNLHPVPDELADEAAVFAEPVAAAFEILEQVHVEPGMQVVVQGDGKLGLLVAQVLHQAGAEVLAVGHHRQKLALLAGRGIGTLLAEEWAPEAEMADLVVEATGSAAGFARAVAATRPRGTLVLKSTVAERLPVDLAPLVIHEIQVVGSRCGPFPPALRALAQGTVQVASLVQARLPLARGEEALRLAQQPGALKVLLECA